METFFQRVTWSDFSLWDRLQQNHEGLLWVKTAQISIRRLWNLWFIFLGTSACVLLTLCSFNGPRSHVCLISTSYVPKPNFKILWSAFTFFFRRQVSNLIRPEMIISYSEIQNDANRRLTKNRDNFCDTFIRIKKTWIEGLKE